MCRVLGKRIVSIISLGAWTGGAEGMLDRMLSGRLLVLGVLLMLAAPSSTLGSLSHVRGCATGYVLEGLCHMDGRTFVEHGGIINRHLDAPMLQKRLQAHRAPRLGSRSSAPASADQPQSNWSGLPLCGELWHRLQLNSPLHSTPCPQSVPPSPYSVSHTPHLTHGHLLCPLSPPMADGAGVLDARRLY